MGACAASEGAVNLEKVDMSHFSLLSTVGKGGFGKVKAAQDRKDPVPSRYDDIENSSVFYAMKLQDLRELIRKESHWKAAWVERTVMASVKSPFVVKLHYAFISSMDLVLVMPFLRGGDLNFYLENSGPMEEDMARFYIAEILLGLEAIHKLNFVYRDLKPENCILDAKGHLYITDLGLATMLQEKDRRYRNDLFSKRYPPPHHLRTRGCCGTPGYVAPEVINRHSYGFMPDFFTFGATLARMLLKRSPFNPKLMDRSKVRKDDFPTPKLPKKISHDCRDIVGKLCAFREEKRLGYVGFWKTVREHPFFANAPNWNWKKIENKTIKPPHTPSLKKLNFNPVYEAEEQIMAEGRKPLDKTEREKVEKVFNNIDYNTKPPFRNSAGDLFPPNSATAAGSQVSMKKSASNGDTANNSTVQRLNEFKNVPGMGVNSIRNRADTTTSVGALTLSNRKPPSQHNNETKNVHLGQPSLALSQIEGKSEDIEHPAHEIITPVDSSLVLGSGGVPNWGKSDLGSSKANSPQQSPLKNTEEHKTSDKNVKESDGNNISFPLETGNTHTRKSVEDASDGQKKSVTIRSTIIKKMDPVVISEPIEKYAAGNDGTGNNGTEDAKDTDDIIPDDNGTSVKREKYQSDAKIVAGEDISNELEVFKKNKGNQNASNPPTFPDNKMINAVLSEQLSPSVNPETIKESFNHIDDHHIVREITTDKSDQTPTNSGNDFGNLKDTEVEREISKKENEIIARGESWVGIENQESTTNEEKVCENNSMINL